MNVQIKTAAFDPWGELAQYQDSTNKKIGACASFVGTMRDINEGLSVTSMTLEYYPGMSEKQLERIVSSKLEQHQLEDVLLIHRVGEIQPSDAIVLVACFSGHRKQAFDACREIMEDLKHIAPFWKREKTEQGDRWVEKNTPG